MTLYNAWYSNGGVTRDKVWYHNSFFVFLRFISKSNVVLHLQYMKIFYFSIWNFKVENDSLNEKQMYSACVYYGPFVILLVHPSNGNFKINRIQLDRNQIEMQVNLAVQEVSFYTFCTHHTWLMCITYRIRTFVINMSTFDVTNNLLDSFITGMR